MARYSYPTRTSRPGVFRAPSREAVQRRRRLAWLATSSAGVDGLVWTVQLDWDRDGYDNGDDDVTARALSRATVQAEFGRDQARALRPTTAGRASAELDNVDRHLSPDNTASPLHGRILPARPWRIQARLDGTIYTLFAGHLDDYRVQPRIEARSVQITGLDAVARLKGVKISTPLYKGVRTGDAIGHVLDAVGFTGDRDIDPGATTIRWWWATEEDAFQAITDLIESEGPGAFLHADATGGIVFRDRHHRLLAEESTTAQASFQPDTPLSFQDMTLDLGWADIINSVAITVDELDPSPYFEEIWTTPDSIVVDADATVTVDVSTDDPIVLFSVFLTYGVPAGAVTASWTQPTAQSITLSFTGGPTGAVITQLTVWGQPVAKRRSFDVTGEDTASIAKYGARDPQTVRGRWVGQNDAAAIVALVLAARAERLPLVTIMLDSGTHEPDDRARLLQQLGRDLSDRVHILEHETCVDYDVFLERIKHRISDGGMLLRTEFTLEKAPQQAANVFRFDSSDYGFDNGVFAADGLDDPEDLFIFDAAGRGFGDGVFAS